MCSRALYFERITMYEIFSYLNFLDEMVLKMFTFIHVFFNVGRSYIGRAL